MSEPEPNVVLRVQLEGAAIGDVLQDSDLQEIPEGWHLMDGSTYLTWEWPEFAAAMRIKGPTFTLPAPQRVNPGHHWIIRLGERRPMPPKPPAVPRSGPPSGR